jgi:hypothetical protein
VEQSSRRQGAITILENPGPGVLVKEKKTRALGAQLALGLPFCIAFSVSAVLALDMLNASLKLTPKIEKALGVQVVAVIPPVDGDLGAAWETYKRENTLPADVEPLLEDEDSPSSPPVS